ncbi:glycine, alanine and asparagine-rich protein isoform X1 [Neodiprion pinetum]|uniref:glycine, alanine and asparagine-rich protein isoform X1 n=1 Tax=Neodiprion pinetum TaxID=441929 RepID=UPI001EDCB246|nr:pupal cuticle protein 36 isoform X1 [Neodiprion pinetum]
MSMRKVEVVLLAVFGLLVVTGAKPQGLGQFLTFKDGNVGVNFGGYHAEAGLGGLLGGGRTSGGLHASAGTPSGANAQAGLGGLLDGNGYTGGGLHASAGLGGSTKAAANIGGELSGQGIAQGGYFAGATAGGSAAAVEKQSYGVVQQPVIVEHEVKVPQSVPDVQVENTFDAHVSQSVPNIASKSTETQVFQSVPTVTKTVQTETVVPDKSDLVQYEHVQKIKTRVTPKKLKTRVSTFVKSRVRPSIQSGVFVEKAIYPATSWNIEKSIQTQTNAGQQVPYSNAASADVSASAGLNVGAYGSGFGGAYGGGWGGGYGGANFGGAGFEDASYGSRYYVKSQPNSQLFDDIFNIPISTLTAVNQLLRNKGK